MYGSRGDSEEGIVGNPRVIHIITEGACMCTQNRGLRRWAEWLNLNKKRVELLENTYTFNPTPPPPKNKSGQHSLISRNIVCLFNCFFFHVKTLYVAHSPFLVQAPTHQLVF